MKEPKLILNVALHSIINGIMCTFRSYDIKNDVLEYTYDTGEDTVEIGYTNYFNWEESSIFEHSFARNDSTLCKLIDYNAFTDTIEYSYKSGTCRDKGAIISTAITSLFKWQAYGIVKH